MDNQISELLEFNGKYAGVVGVGVGVGACPELDTPPPPPTPVLHVYLNF